MIKESFLLTRVLVSKELETLNINFKVSESVTANTMAAHLPLRYNTVVKDRSSAITSVH